MPVAASARVRSAVMDLCIQQMQQGQPCKHRFLPASCNPKPLWCSVWKSLEQVLHPCGIRSVAAIGRINFALRVMFCLLLCAVFAEASEEDEADESQAEDPGFARHLIDLDEKYDHFLKCSNAAIISSDGLQAVFNSSWWTSAAGIFLWTWISFFALMALLGLCRDAHRREIEEWSEEFLLTNRQGYKQMHAAKKACKWMCTPCRVLREAKDCSDYFYALHYRIFTFCTWRVISDYTSILVDDLKPLIRGLAHKATKSHDALADINLTSELHNKAFNSIAKYRKTLFVHKVIKMFRALHPLESLGQFSTTVATHLRVLVLTSQVLGGFALSTLFLDVVQEDSRDNCPYTQSGFGYSMLIGVTSAILSRPVMFVKIVVRRKFEYRPDWTEEKRQARIVKWHIKYFFFMLFGLIYCTCCVLMIGSFLAIVDKRARMKWITSASSQLAILLLIVPSAVALFCVSCLELTENVRPEMTKKANTGFPPPPHAANL